MRVRGRVQFRGTVRVIPDGRGASDVGRSILWVVFVLVVVRFDPVAADLIIRVLVALYGGG